MKCILVIFSSFFMAFTSLNSQSFSVTFKVIDLDSSSAVSGALVFIDELHFEDTETDDYGIAYFEDVPQGKININIRKQGYAPIREQFNVTDKKENNAVLVKLKRLDEQSKIARKREPINIEDSPGTIIIGGDNSGIIQGDNSYLDNSRTYINPKAEIPKPKIKSIAIEYSDVPELYPPIKENELNDTALIKDRLVFKTLIRFKYYSEVQRSNMDFRVRSWNIQDVRVKYVGGMFTSKDIIMTETGKVMGKRIIYPENGEYELTFYNKVPLKDTWKYIEVQMNDIVAIIEK